MQIQIPKLQQAPPYYGVPLKITHRPSPAAIFLDEVGVDEEEVVPAPGSKVNLGAQVKLLFKESSPGGGYMPKKGLYFAGRRPSCTLICLGRSNDNQSDEVHIIPAEHILQLGKLIRENEQPYSFFVIDALSHDALAGVEAIVRETVNNKLYFKHKPLVSVVEKGAEGLLSKLQERYSGAPLRFIEAKKHGDVIDAQLFGQLRY